MAESTPPVPQHIEDAIRVVRRQRVILDADLAALYGVETKALNQAVKRNAARFPDDFAFQLTADEWRALRSQSVTSNTGRGGRRTRPFAFTEHGAVKAANVLRSERAIQISVEVVRAFIEPEAEPQEQRSDHRDQLSPWARELDELPDGVYGDQVPGEEVDHDERARFLARGRQRVAEMRAAGEDVSDAPPELAQPD